jgi:uncharacterized integral membrane protein
MLQDDAEQGATMRREDDERRAPDRPADQPSEESETGHPRPETEDQHLAALRKARQARVAKVVVALGIVVILMIFVIANSKSTAVDFVFFTRQPPLIWVMFACAVLGGIVGYLIGRPGKQLSLRHRRGDEEKR